MHFLLFLKKSLEKARGATSVAQCRLSPERAQERSASQGPDRGRAG